MKNSNDVFIALGLALFAVFGACAKWMSGLTTRERKGMWTVLASEAFIASFCGALVFLSTKILDYSDYLAFVIAGLAGYAGSRGVAFLWKVSGVEKKLGKFPEELDNKEKNDDN